MNEAKTTWALVVGIDVYDVPTKNPPLTGAVRDGIEAVKWLRALGVPDAQILFHASPCVSVQAELDALGRAHKPCREPDIAASIAALKAVPNGTRLFVFLTGHGVFEPAGGRMFLRQEAGAADVWKNVGIDRYVNWFLSLPFPRQFLFMDGCLNYPYGTDQRPMMAPGLPVVDQVPNPNNGLVACFAAGQDQYAIEIDGRGAFSKMLFDLIDLKKIAKLPPGDPLMSAIRYDWNTGRRTLDLGQLISEFVREPVRVLTAEKGNEQTVGLQPCGTAAGRAHHPLVELPAVPTTQVRISVKPAGAVADVMRIRVNAPDLYASCDLPQPPAPLTVPIDLQVPAGIDGDAYCYVQPARWAETRVQRNFRTDAAMNLVEFALTPPLPPLLGGGGAFAGPTVLHSFSVKTVAPDGTPAYALDGPQGAYPSIAERVGYRGPLTDGADVGHGVTLEMHEDGPVFQVPAYELPRGTAVVHRWARAVRATVSTDVVITTRLRGPGAPSDEARIVFALAPGGAASLAGALADLPTVQVSPIGDGEDVPPSRDPQAHSLRDLEQNPVIDVRPGPKRARLTLPWGSWTQVLNADPAQQCTVLLPAKVGNPPLRVLLWKEVQHADSALYVLGPEKPKVQLRPVAGAAPVATVPALLPNPGAWRIGLPSTPAISAIVEDAGRRVEFPLLGSRGLAIERGPGFRVEPLSNVPTPEWDLLVAKGEIDALRPDEASRLTQQKWFDPLLGLAGGYAVYAQRAWPDLQIVTSNLQGLGLNVVDVLLLSIVAATHGDRPTDSHVQQLISRSGQTPIFRWGVRLARSLIEQIHRPGPQLMRWWGRLDRIEQSMARSSVWTTWSAG